MVFLCRLRRWTGERRANRDRNAARLVGHRYLDRGAFSSVRIAESSSQQRWIRQLLRGQRLCGRNQCAERRDLTKSSVSPINHERPTADWRKSSAERRLGAHYGKPIAFPPDGSTVDLLSLDNEWPDPSKGCHFTPPMGLPITLQLGWYLTPRITGGSLSENGKPVQACAFDAMNYRNPDELTQKIGRAGLEYAGVIVIVPRKPLDAGARYVARAVVDNVTYEWTFSTGTKPQARPTQ
jgi:hypothetical protein